MTALPMQVCDYICILYRAFTGKYYKTTDVGIYTCVVCEEELFSSETKFDSGCGWPAFNDVLDQGKVKLTKDTSHGEFITQLAPTNCSVVGHTNLP
jgi:peptide-methionine (R)-S-oxide reductase